MMMMMRQKEMEKFLLSSIDDQDCFNNEEWEVTENISIHLYVLDGDFSLPKVSMCYAFFKVTLKLSNASWEVIFE